MQNSIILLFPPKGKTTTVVFFVHSYTGTKWLSTQLHDRAAWKPPINHFITATFVKLKSELATSRLKTLCTKTSLLPTQTSYKFDYLNEYKP